MELKKACLRMDLSELSLKDLCAVISTLDGISPKEWNDGSKIKSLMVAEIRNYAIDYMLRNYVMDWDRSPEVEAQ